MFIDSVRISVRAGNGGKGCRSFYRDKYNRLGIPNGGDGGRGADVIIRADRNLQTLLDFRYNRHFNGKHGGHGGGKTKRGKDAASLVVLVPCGTLIKDCQSNCLLRDLQADLEEIVVAKGGAGGRGNFRRQEASDGVAGQAKEILLDLKVIADVGVVGFPNSGKSTLISNISSARSKVAAYPFTTKFPVLGVVGSMDEAFVVADIPGIIEGASKGRGLGDKFLRHIERTKVLIHILDISGSQGRDPLDDYKLIISELKSYGGQVHKKPQVIVANKMDLEGAEVNLLRLKQVLNKKIYPISALKLEGLEELIEAVRKKI